MEGGLKIVLLPGMDGTGDLFREFVRFLPQSLEVVIVRYPTQDVLSYAMLERLVRAACSGSAPFVLVTESFSTPMALEFAAADPLNLRGLILCAGFATAPVKGWGRFLLPPLASFVFNLPLPAFAAKKWLVGPSAPESLVVAVRDAVAAVKPRVLTSRLRAILGCDAREAAARIGVPMLYIRATRDRLVDRSSMDELRRINPQMAVAELDGPHLIVQREPQGIATVVVNFIRGLEA
jgi:pimeloyl-[acyl-carrier protein] methyl ester esterase